MSSEYWSAWTAPESPVVEDSDLLAFVRERYGTDAENKFAGVLAGAGPAGFEAAVRRSLTREFSEGDRS